MSTPLQGKNNGEMLKSQVISRLFLRQMMTRRKLAFNGMHGVQTTQRANHAKETSLKGRLVIDGTANWKKEIWHDGGYTDARTTEQASDDSFIDKWIGWKVIMYNTQEDNAVKMESYLDEDNNNDWKQVTSLVDSGDWFARSSDEKFFSADCGLPKDYVVTNSGQVAAFSDQME